MHILAWQKYWLMAVSSMVRARFSASMTSGCPCIDLLQGDDHRLLLGKDMNHRDAETQRRQGGENSIRALSSCLLCVSASRWFILFLLSPLPRRPQLAVEPPVRPGVVEALLLRVPGQLLAEPVADV